MNALEELCDQLDAYANTVEEETQIVAELEEQCFGEGPNSIKNAALIDAFAFYRGKAILMITDDQMWEEQINMFGQKLPRYKPSTIRKKAKLGFPPDKLVNYTNYWTGALKHSGIEAWIEVDNGIPEFVFEAVGKYAVIPEDRFGLTEENLEYLSDMVYNMARQTTKQWMFEQLQLRGINPYKYGYFDF